MRVLITGGAGFIGSHIVDALLERGDEPFVVDNLETGSRINLPPQVPFFEVDICDQPGLAKVFAEVRPEAVCHQAAQLSVSRSMREPVFDAQVNVIGWLHVLDLAAQSGVQRVVFASSGGVLYGDVTEPADESFPPRPASPYGISKWIGEQYLQFYAREKKLEGIALRYANVYGPRQNPHGEAGVVAIFCQKMLEGKGAQINGDGGYLRDYVFGPDVAEANILALRAPLSEPFLPLNIGTGIQTDVNELAAQLQTHTQTWLQSHGRAMRVPPCTHGPAREGDLRSNVIAPEKARARLGWKPSLTLDQGLQQTVEWFASRI